MARELRTSSLIRIHCNDAIFEEFPEAYFCLPDTYPYNGEGHCRERI